MARTWRKLLDVGDGPYTLLFVCAICEREVRDYPTRSGRDRHLAPLCRYCEGAYSKAVNVGAFMDRRIIRQIQSLSEILSGRAYSQVWEMNHAKA